jgi:hypothetical protein
MKEILNAQHAIENMSVSGIDELSQGNAAWQNVQTPAPSAGSAKTDSSSIFGWENVQLAHKFSQSVRCDDSHMKDWILLDSQSTIHHFYNPQCVGDIKQAERPITLLTNVGEKVNNKECTVKGVGRAYFDQEGLVNVLSLAKIEQQHRVTYDSAKESAFLVHTNKGIVKFNCSPEGLYYMVPDNPKAPIFLQTIEENLKKYSRHQIEGAYRARDLLHALSCPSVADLKKALQMNAIANCPVTINNVTRAEDISGPDIASLKGKTTHHKPSPYVKEVVDIPP